MKLSFGKACIPREDGYEPGEKSLSSIIIGEQENIVFQISLKSYNIKRIWLLGVKGAGVASILKFRKKLHTERWF